ncbi:type I restriction enzyme R protein, partial [Helicobacter pylori]
EKMIKTINRLKKFKKAS